MPRRNASRGEAKVTGAPSQRISPASGRSAPAMSLRRVDLPAPFSPTTACTSPAATARSTASRAVTPGYRFDAKDLLLGAQVSWPMTPQLDLYPSFDYYFQSPGSLWALNFDLKYRPPTRYGAWYVGGGLNFLGGSGGTSTNLNLLTGLE